jgi:hypothetical protein
MPFEAAKAVTATFCYNIRYALTPLFGEDFLSMCIRSDSPRFGRMIIDKDIISRCTEVADELRLLSDPRNSSLEASIAPNTKPSIPGAPKGWFSRNLRPKVPNIERAEVESGYGTDTDTSERCNVSPVTSVGPVEGDGLWARLHPDSPTSLKKSKSRKPPPSPGKSPRLVMPWQSIEQAVPVSAAPESFSHTKRSLSPIGEDRDVDDDQEDLLSSDTASAAAPRRVFGPCTEEENAAYLIMELHRADAALRDPPTKRQRPL